MTLGGDSTADGSAVLHRRLNQILDRPHVPLLSDKSDIMTSDMVIALSAELPARFRVSDWYLVYSTWKHGFSINTLYSKVEDYGPTIMAIRDAEKNVFGCFASEAWRLSNQYYGSGESFLFTFRSTRSLEVFRWSHRNSFFQMGKADSLAMGGGDHFGLYVDAELLDGSSGACETFESQPLSNKVDFKVVSLEIWGFSSSKTHTASLQAFRRASATRMHPYIAMK